ncbi:MAG: hypothetical protein FWB88_07665 [Defluviitaleaceae bacterium]|nr:hypothetical protein [Defluviitaleaceae bacterium]MCL2203801.1 hypothetical protein [Defluviitaleaceae bacterium]MCL2239270.1 hypothetical protein [Defluviitaleaceae bacterium]
MIKFMAGQKGQGKTRKLIDMANEALKQADGHLVYIDDDRRHTREIDRDIRFVEAGKGVLSNYREFVGFIMGILSQNADIEHIYVDGLSNIIKTLDNESLQKLAKKLDAIAQRDEVAFTISINYEPDTLPEDIRALLM